MTVPRTSDGLVRELLGPDFDARRVTTPFITTAASLVDRLVTCATRKGLTVSDIDLELLERWLAAHCYQMSDPGYQERATGKASGVFTGRTGMRLEATRYGQTALDLDYTGCLYTLSNGRRASMAWLGKPPSQQTDFPDRD